MIAAMWEFSVGKSVFDDINPGVETPLLMLWDVNEDVQSLTLIMTDGRNRFEWDLGNFSTYHPTNHSEGGNDANTAKTRSLCSGCRGANRLWPRQHPDPQSIAQYAAATVAAMQTSAASQARVVPEWYPKKSRR